MKDTDLFRIALALVPGIGPVNGKALMAYCGSAEMVFRESPALLARIPGIGQNVARAIQDFNDFDRAEQELQFVRDQDIRLLFFTDPDYPYRLRHITDGPLALYVRGSIDLNAQRMLSIVGTRKPTRPGIQHTRRIIAGLRSAGCTIISGMAYGIDIIAHRAALDHQLVTGGVVAHGLDLMYPSSHSSTAREMIGSGGGIITEFPTKTKPDAPHFPRRNRIVAGLSDAVLVMESAEQGGSLITADLAFQYNRDVLAIPGRIDDARSKGCNLLIKQLKAALVESAEDILGALNWDAAVMTNIQQTIPADLTKDEKFVVEILNGDVVAIDQLSARTEMAPGRLSHVLLELELRGLIDSLPGKKFKRK